MKKPMKLYHVTATWTAIEVYKTSSIGTSDFQDDNCLNLLLNNGKIDHTQAHRKGCTIFFDWNGKVTNFTGSIFLKSAYNELNITPTRAFIRNPYSGNSLIMTAIEYSEGILREYISENLDNTKLSFLNRIKLRFCSKNSKIRDEIIDNILKEETEELDKINKELKKNPRNISIHGTVVDFLGK